MGDHNNHVNPADSKFHDEEQLRAKKVIIHAGNFKKEQNLFLNHTVFGACMQNYTSKYNIENPYWSAKSEQNVLHRVQ